MEKPAISPDMPPRFRLARRNLGGMSGDIAGFSITLGELSGLLILAIF